MYFMCVFPFVIYLWAFIHLLRATYVCVVNHATPGEECDRNRLVAVTVHRIHPELGCVSGPSLSYVVLIFDYYYY